MNSSSLHTHYDNLKVSRKATQEVIDTAYKILSQKYHPDKSYGDANARRLMELVNIAYYALSDPTRRAEYDRWILDQETGLKIKQNSHQNKENSLNVNGRNYNKSQSKIVSNIIDVVKDMFKMLGLGVFCITVAIVIAVLVSKKDISNNNYNSDSVLVLQPLPNTGDSDNPDIYGAAPLEIKIPRDGDHYWVKIDNSYTGEHLVSYFIRSGDTLKTQLPSGNYTLKYAYGGQWYGMDYLFGSHTNYGQADSVMNFSSDGYGGYSGVSIELIKQVNGNLRTSNINANQF